MVYIFVALFAEAKPLIQSLALKKQRSDLPFEQYIDAENHFCLVLTGVGSVAAATAVGSICAAYQVCSGDFLCNVGTCAGAQPGQAFLIHKITEEATGRTFYPDLLYRSPFAECPVVTVSRPVRSDDRITASGFVQSGMDESGAAQAELSVCDMEAAGFYQAGARFVGPHRIACIKVVSDTGKGESVTSSQLTQRISGAADQIAGWLRQIGCMLGEEAQRVVRFSRKEEEMLQGLCRDLHCSETMRSDVCRQLFYAKLTGAEIVLQVEAIYEEGLLPCRDRREGKRCWNDIRQRFF